MDEIKSKIIYLDNIGETEWPFSSRECERISSMTLAKNNLRCLFAQKEIFTLLIFFNNFLSRYLIDFNYLFWNENNAQVLDYLVGKDIRFRLAVFICILFMAIDTILTRRLLKSVSFLNFNSLSRLQSSKNC